MPALAGGTAQDFFVDAPPDSNVATKPCSKGNVSSSIRFVIGANTRGTCRVVQYDRQGDFD
jgi:hypothetical protein